MAPGGSVNTGTATALQLQDGSVTFMTAAGLVEAVPQECLHKSKVLRDLLDSTDGAAEVPVPVTPAALQLWVRHAQHAQQQLHPVAHRKTDRGVPSTGTPDAASAELRSPGHASRTSRDGMPDSGGGLGLTTREACLLLTVADVLVDDTTCDRCTRAVAAMMAQRAPASTGGAGEEASPSSGTGTSAAGASGGEGVPTGEGSPSSGEGHPAAAVHEAVAALPEHLQLSVLSRTHLAHCLSHLPPAWHPLVLRAHHPAIDSHATLAFHRLPVPAVHAALSAAATLTALRALSLAGLTLPLDAAPCLRELGCLTALTALDLHDIGLQQRTAAALTAVLPMLRQLEDLNLSSNQFTHKKMQALAPGLRRCTGLRSLNLWECVDMDHDNRIADELISALTPLQLLTSVAIGVYTCRYGRISHLRDPLSDSQRQALLEVLMQLPELVSLRLDLCSAMTENYGMDELFRRLAQVPVPVPAPQLQSLRCTVPPDDSCIIPFSDAAQLTSLELEILQPWDGYVPVRLAEAKMSALRHLTQLQRLWLKLPVLRRRAVDHDPCEVLSQSLPCMPHLSHLELRATALGTYTSRKVLHMDGSSVTGVIGAARALPQLRVLHVPVFATDRRLEHTVGALLPAPGVQLSVDLYMRVANHDVLTAVAMGALVQLFSYVETLDVLCACARDMDILQPVIDGTAALRNLRALRLGAMLEGSEIDRPVVALLHGMLCLTQLRSLEVSFCDSRSLWKSRHATNSRRHPGAMRSQQLGGFMRALGSLHALTRLSFDMRFVDAPGHEDLLRACATLPSLHVLELDDLATWELPLCRDVLPRLPLRVLRVSLESLSILHAWMEDWQDACLYSSGDSSEGSSEEATTETPLPHLRCLEMAEWPDYDTVPASVEDEFFDSPERLTQVWPGFQLIGIHDRLSYRNYY